MKIKVFDEHFTNSTVETTISFRQWLQLKLWGYVYLYHATKHGWTGQLPFYIVHCSQHGYYIDYPHGFPEHNQGFDCPMCLNEISVEAKQ